MVLPAVFACRGPERTSVLLVVLDTVAGGHVGYIGYERDTTPVLDSLAGAGAAFTACQATSPWTLPSGASIFTGLLPRSHGARRYSDGRVMGADPRMPTLSMVFKAEGYRTGGFVNNYLLGEEFGWHVGYDRFSSEHLGLTNAGPTVDACLQWLEGLEENDDFFAMVHFFDPHDPYDPPAPFDTLFGSGGPPHNWNTRSTGEPPDPSLRPHLIDLYDGEIAHVDHQMGRLLAGLRELGLAENTLVIVVADHGEEFLERGFIWHGKALTQEVLHVPLVMSGPGVPRGRYDDPVSQVDIVPTVAELVQVDWPGPVDGTDLFAEEGPVPVFSSNLNAGPYWPMAVLTEDEKILWETTTDTWLAFDLENDPDRLNPVAPDSEAIELALDYWSIPLIYSPLPVNRNRVNEILSDLGYI